MEDDSQFAEFVAKRADALLRYGYALSGNPHDAADLAQEALIKLHRAWAQVRRKEDPESYTRVIMARLHISAWRRRHREELVWALLDTPLQEVLPSEADQELWQALEFWYVPVSGGEPASIDTDRAVEGRGDELAVVGDKLAFSLHEGGVFTVPLEGGTVSPVAGADRHHILRWPWVGTPGQYTPDNETSFEELLNVETGQTSKAVVRPGEKSVRCGVMTCVGNRSDHTSFYRLRDGSQERDLPESTLGLAYDRFMTVSLPQPRGAQALLDLASGKSADLGLRLNAKGQVVSVQPGLTGGRLVAYELKNQYVIIDLTKIR